MGKADKHSISELFERLSRNRGDEQAWELLQRTFWPFVMANTYRNLRGQRDLAEDASQDVFYRLLRYCDFKKFKDQDEFRAYVKVICRNVARDYLSHITEYSEDLSIEKREKLLALVNDTVTPEQSARASELLNKILSWLDDESRRLTKLLLEGYSVDEIAQQLGISYSNAAVRIHRLRLMLRKYLTDNGVFTDIT